MTWVFAIKTFCWAKQRILSDLWEKMQRLQPGSSIFFSCNNTTNLPSLLPLKLYWDKLCVFWGGQNIPKSFCIQNVQGISLRKSKWTEGHWWRLDCNALRQSWSIRWQLFIFAICQQWLWSMRDNSSRAKTSHVCNIHLHGTRASWYGPTLRK